MSLIQSSSKNFTFLQILSFFKNSPWNLKFFYIFRLSPLCMNEESWKKAQEIKFYIDSFSNYILYSELSNKHAANLILFEKIFPPTCLIRTYTFIYFQGKFLPTWLLEYLCLLILAEIPNYKIILSSFKLLFCCFKHFKEASKS